MSVVLLPGIANLDTESLCHSIYSQLYLNFFNAQDQKDEDHPWGIVEGDDTSVRLRNMAYNFAEAISGAVEGDSSGEGGVLTDYIKKTGGDMTGVLRANYGFEAGCENTRVLHTYYEDNKYGVQLSGDLRIGGSNLYMGGKQIIRYNTNESATYIDSPFIDFGSSNIKSKGEWLFGQNKETGILISATMLQIGGMDVFHRGNANLETVSWSMKDANISGGLTVTGSATVGASLKAQHGIELGYEGKTLLYTVKDTVAMSSFLSFGVGFGIKFDGVPVLMRVNERDIQLSTTGGHLLLGNEQTFQIRLFTGLTDIDGEHILVSKYGAAYFPDSLTVRHSYGDTLLSTYRTSSGNEGVIIHKYLRFDNKDGAFLSGNNEGIRIRSTVVINESHSAGYLSFIGHRLSTSLYKVQDRTSASTFLLTTTDFFTFDKPVEAKGHIGIDNSLTRLTDGCLFLTNGNYLLSTPDGIRYSGDSYFIGSVGSELFSSGLVGSGWAIARNGTTSNIVATFDELVIRKKMRVYEMEIQKTTATNGSLWISDSFSGETVEKLT